MSEQVQDRAAGAIMGAFIGDALGLGPHWYYNLDALHRDYGEWIDDYTTPKSGRYHSGMKAGQLSQAGFILKMLLQSLIDKGTYNEEDFCHRIEEDFFPLLDGTPMNGPGGYTSQSIREAWRRRVIKGLPWGQTAGKADTTEAIERTLVIAVRYALQPTELAEYISSNTLLTQDDEMVVALTVAYGAVLGLLVQGHSLDSNITNALMAQVRSKALPFHSVTRANMEAPHSGEPEQPRAGKFASPDALLSAGYMAAAAMDPDISIEPAWKVSLVYGMPCAIYHILPASYYLAARFKDDFTSAVLHAINGGGQNQARAILTGALVGAQVGLSGIPKRFVDGLEDGEMLQKMSIQLAEQAAM